MSKRELDILLCRIAQGDNAAFETLYEKTKRGVYAFLYTYFHNAADAEDGMQTVYLKVKQGIGGYRAGTNPSAWLLQIAKNHALNELAKLNRVKTEGLTEIAVSYEPSEDDTVTELMQRILSEEEQRIVTLHVLWNYKHKEIAEMLGCPVGTVTSKYKRAIEKLKKALKEAEK